MNPFSLQKKTPSAEEKFSVEQGFSICLHFFLSLWPMFEAETLDPVTEKKSAHEIFLLFVCMGDECSPHWNEAIFRVKKIPKEEQKTLKLNSEELFLCTLEFCKFWNEIFHERVAESNIDSLQRLLESMLASPPTHIFEWELWQKATNAGLEVSVATFDWNDELGPSGER
jgi:hypothetical protein